jgi:peptidoglycan hydrolase-like protein with peptidoglycan-binding domain
MEVLKMWKRAALAAALAALLALAAGCTASDIGADQEPTDGAVDIIVPYATTTISPGATQAPDALLIDSDGQVVLNDDSVLNGAVPTDEATQEEASGSKYAQLRFGDTSTAVSNLQERLAELGYFTEGVSGIFDESTEKAVKLFEKSYGTMQTGIATAALQERLFAETALAYGSDEYIAAVNAQYRKLEKGDVGSDVIALQTRLQELGYPIEEATGVYDDQTVNAVRMFYEMYGYKARDYAIVDLQKVLYADDAKRCDAGAAADDDATEAPETQDYSLKQGDTGTRVTQLQLRLVELGYLADATGTYDQATSDAVSQFQIASRLEADGVASEDLQRQLFSEDAPKSGETKQIYALLQWGDSGDAVADLQTRLKELGYCSGEADGVFSDELVAIVKRFQSAAGLEETGVASVDLQELLFSDSAPLSPAKAAEAQEDAAAAEVVISPLMSGDSGDDVVALQTRLSELGYYAGTLDGKFGGGTQKAVEKAQKAIGVQQTGEASADLINLLDSDAAPKSGDSYGAAKEYAALAPGDAGDSVIELQRRLWELGYLVKEDIADSIGTYEDVTAASVNAVMKAAGFKLRDGRAPAEFQAFLFSKAAEAVKK